MIQKLFRHFIFISLLFSLFVTPIHAQVVGIISSPQSVVRNVSQIGSFISVIIIFITTVAGIYALWQFITGGLGYISSQGDKAKVQQSTQQITMAILGLTTIGISFILAIIISRLLFGASFNILSPTLKSI